ncbi:MAG: hypothetical protein PVG03_12030 [Desulfarculaceae bacterium]|jgi:hypothetical protein
MKLSNKVLLWGMILIFGLAAGCAWMDSDKGQTGKQASGEPAGPVGRYYDFDDIQVPNSLDLEKDQSILFRVGAFKAGLLVFTDRVESESLVNFFVEGMAKDNWALKSSFKYPQVALFFAKKGKTCVVHIIEGTLSTRVEIWVAPAL